MPTQTFTLLNKANHNGTDRTVTATIPAGAQVVASRYYVDSTNNQGVIQYTNPATHINLTSQLSFDGGATWQNDAGFTSDGGYVDRNGVARDPAITTTYNPPLGGGVMVVANVETIGTVRYGLFVDVTTL